MSHATGIMLAAGTISFANEWVHTGTPNFRIVMSTLAGSLIVSGLAQLNETLGSGLASIILVSVVLTPIDGDSPFMTADKLVSGQPFTRSGINTKGSVTK